MVSRLLKTLHLIATAAFFFLFSSNLAFAQDSYIIVHAHNPESVEIASIQGMSSNSVEIYDGDTLIGYGAYNAETHNKPLLISSGTRTVKAKFNGMTKEQTITVNPNEIKVAIFTFERTEFDILSKISEVFRGSHELIFSKSFNREYYELRTVIKEGRFFKKYFIKYYGTGNINISLKFYFTGTSYYRAHNCHYLLARDFFIGYIQDFSMLESENSDGGNGIYYEPNFIPENASFTKWCIQSITEGSYPRFILLIDGDMYAKEIIPGISGYNMRSVSANTHYDEIRGSGMAVRNVVDIILSGEMSIVREEKGELSAISMSSVPYDLTGTGVKDGEEKLLPVAAFVYSPEKQSVGKEIAFDASASNDPDGTIVKYEWDFGDEATGEGVKVTHNYAKPGEYTVTLTVTDNDGLTDSTKLSFVVKSSLAPVALFAYFPEELFSNEEIAFDASSSNDPDGTIVKYEWDFGDGTSAEGIKVTHSYIKDGEYTVALTVTDNDGLTGSTELSLMVKSSFDLEILDGVDFSAGREVSDDPERLVSIKGTPVEGAVTDGVTRLVLKVNTDIPDAMTFSLEGTGNPNEDGVLRSIDGFQQGSTITVNTANTSDGEKAFAIYQAPENFVRQGYSEDSQASERKIRLKVKPNRLPASELSEEIKLVRPPVILIHGLWSGPKMWSGFSNSLGNKLPGIRILVVDYEEKNSNYLEDNKDVPYSCKGDSIIKAREDLRSQGIAMVQADVLGHSMGGLLARIWSEAGEKKYYRDDNFKIGDINKLITLDSPHFGSFLADFIIEFINNRFEEDIRDEILQLVRETGFSLDGGAVEDLETMSPPILYMNIIPTDSLSHALIGDFKGSMVLDPKDTGNLVYILIRAIEQNLGINILPSRSDLVVSVDSQASGLALPKISVFGHWHCDATGEEVVNKTVELLNTDVLTASFLFESGFPINKWPE